MRGCFYCGRALRGWICPTHGYVGPPSRVGSVTQAPLTAAGVTYENLNANGDVGSGATQVAQGNHTHGAGTCYLPIGGIIMWSGTIATIPANFQLCNGTNGTPDLRDRMIVGASSDSGGVAKSNVTGSLTQSGGSASHHHANHTFTQPDSHGTLTHSGGSAGISGSTAAAVTGISIPNHSTQSTKSASSGTTQTTVSTATHSVTEPNSGTGHTHAYGTLSVSHSDPSSHGTLTHTNGAVDAHDTLAALPPYYALAFIQRMS